MRSAAGPNPMNSPDRSLAWRFRRLAAAAALGLAPLPARTAATLEGTVLNQNTRRFLERAVVQVEGTAFQAVTDKEGAFRIAGLPAGTYTLVATYTELDPVTRTVTVTADQTARTDFELTASGIYQLGQFVVSSTVEGNAFAINQQRRAESARSVTSVDAFTDVSTGNPGEFLRNISGIQMDYSQNEPNRIRLRGQDPVLTSVTMDGNEIASAASSGTNRVLEIDQLSMAAIESVEVFKAPIPSMSANAIGGAVNFVSKSAFDQKGRRASAQIGVMTDSHDFFGEFDGPGHSTTGRERAAYPVGRLTYSDSFLGNRLGLVFSAGRDHTHMLGSSVSHALNTAGQPAAPAAITAANTTVRRGALSFAPNRQLRTRSDYSLNTDYRLTEHISVFLKNSLTFYHSTNRNHGWTLTPGAPNTLSPGSTLESYTTTTGTASQGVSVFDKHTTSWQINPGLKFRSGPWKTDLIGGFSKSTNHYENPNNFTALSIATESPLGWTITTPVNDEKPSAIAQTAGPDFYSLNSYRPNQGSLATEGQRTNHAGFVSNNVRNSSEVRWSGRLDVQRDFALRIPFYLKAGLSYNETIRDKRQPQRRWYWVGDDGLAGTADDTTAAGAQLARFAEPVPVTQQIPGFNLREPTYFSTTKLFEYWQQNPRVMVENLAYAEEQKFLGKQKINEQITGYYLMGNASVRKLNILAGARVEETEIVAQGSRTLPTTGARSVLPPGVNANSLEGVLAKYRFLTTRDEYRSDPFPYLHLRYEWLPNLQSRASYTEGIGRPNFSQLIPSLTQTDTPTGGFDGTVSVTRVGLLPQRSQNLDFSLEYYTRSAGVWEAAWFSRDIDHYISSTTIPMTPELLTEFNLGSEFANYRLSTSENLGNASWRGFEVSVRQKLRHWPFVPEWLSGIEIWANHTRIYEMEGTFGGAATAARITHLSGVVDSQVNGGISYRSPRGKFYVHLKTNYQAARPTANVTVLGPSNQRNPRQEAYQFWDMELSYRLRPKVTLTVVGRNLANERAKFTEIGIVTNRQQATGISWMFATKFDL